MGTQKSLFLHLLETPWRQSSPVIAFERTHPLVLKIGRCFLTKGPSGSSAYTAHQQLLHKGCHPVLPAHPLPWVHPAAGPLSTCRYCQPLDIPTGGPEPGVEAERRRRQYREEEGRPPSGSFFFFFFRPFWFGVVFSPSLRPCAYTFGNMTGLLPKVARTPKSAIPTLEGCASPSLSRGSSSPGGCLCSSSAPWKQESCVSRILSLGVTAKVFSLLFPPVAAPWLKNMVNIYYFQRNQIFYRENMFEVRMFSLGEGGGPLPGVGPPPVEVPQVLGCCCEGLTSYLHKVGSKNRTGWGRQNLPELLHLN